MSINIQDIRSNRPTVLSPQSPVSTSPVPVLPTNFCQNDIPNALLAISWASSNGLYQYYFTAVTRDECYFTKMDLSNPTAGHRFEDVNTKETPKRHEPDMWNEYHIVF